MNQCASCGTPLQGKFCHQCGEKTIDPQKDFALSKYLEQGVDVLTHLDKKLFKTLKYLLFRPGLLSLEYIQGRRVAYMKPLQILAIAIFIFYLFFGNFTFFTADVASMDMGYRRGSLANIFHYDVSGRLAAVAAHHRLPLNAVLTEFREKSIHNSKAFLFLLVPFWSLFLYALYYRKYRHYVPHLILATHCLTFLILLLMGCFSLFRLLQFHITDQLMTIALLLYFVYFGFALKWFYQQGTAITIVKTFTAIIAFLAVFIMYRQAVAIYTVTRI